MASDTADWMKAQVMVDMCGKVARGEMTPVQAQSIIVLTTNVTWDFARDMFPDDDWKAMKAARAAEMEG